jgi:DNA-binding CsgD family transcriptional regulator
MLPERTTDSLPDPGWTGIPWQAAGVLEAASFEAHPDPQLVFDERAGLVASNRSARALLAAEGSPGALANELAERAEQLARAAREAIARAIDARCASGEIAVSLAPRASFALRVVPLGPPHHHALVTLRTLEAHPAQRTRARFELTPMEGRVADRLCRGLAPVEIAQELGISIETVRSHLKQAFVKTGVHRQAELVARLLGA